MLMTIILGSITNCQQSKWNLTYVLYYVPLCTPWVNSTFKESYTTMSYLLLGKNVHPLTVVTISDQMCHFEAKPPVINLGQT